VATSLLETGNMMQSVKSVVLTPPAKVNISLVVFGERPDGYHDLHTVVAGIDLHDELRICVAETPGIRLYYTGEPVPAGADNLVYRAAKLLERFSPKPLALDISLHKSIPAGAGLGGGSSDAAACLMGINHLAGLGLSEAELAALAAQLGSDVPFFIYGSTAVCTGRGEIVEPLSLHCQGALLLIVPHIHVSTAEVYRHYQHEAERTEAQQRQVQMCLEAGDLDRLLGLGINSLTEAALELFPALGELRDKIEGLGIGPLHLAGSGSSFFAVSSAEQIGLWAGQLKKLPDADIRVLIRSIKSREWSIIPPKFGGLATFF